MTTPPKRFDASQLLGPRNQGATVPQDHDTKAPWLKYERVSAYVRSDQREWLEEVAHRLRNSTVTDVLRVAIDALREQEAQGFDVEAAIIAAAERDVAAGYGGKGKIGVPRRRN